MQDARPSPPDPTYRAPARLLHWTIALAILATIPVGTIMVQEGLSRAVQNSLFIFHKNIGVAILLLMVVRLMYRAAYPPPALPATVPALQRRIAGWTHVLLYFFVIVMAVSGYVRVVAGGFPLELWDYLGVPRLAPRSDDLAQWAKTVHATARLPLGVLIAAHVGAAFYHAIVLRDGVFSRMWPGARG